MNSSLLLENYIVEAIKKDKELELLIYEFFAKKSKSKSLNEDISKNIKDLLSSATNLEKVLVLSIASLAYTGFNIGSKSKNLTRDSEIAYQVSNELKKNKADKKHPTLVNHFKEKAKARKFDINTPEDLKAIKTFLGIEEEVTKEEITRKEINGLAVIFQALIETAYSAEDIKDQETFEKLFNEYFEDIEVEELTEEDVKSLLKDFVSGDIPLINDLMETDLEHIDIIADFLDDDSDDESIDNKELNNANIKTMKKDAINKIKFLDHLTAINPDNLQIQDDVRVIKEVIAAITGAKERNLFQPDRNMGNLADLCSSTKAINLLEETISGAGFAFYLNDSEY